MPTKTTSVLTHKPRPCTSFEYKKDGVETTVCVSEASIKMLKKAIKEAVTDDVVDDLAELIIKQSPEIYDIRAEKQPIEIDVKIAGIYPVVLVTAASQ
jgi:hypothetical protein